MSRCMLVARQREPSKTLLSGTIHARRPQRERQTASVHKVGAARAVIAEAHEEMIKRARGTQKGTERMMTRWMSPPLSAELIEMLHYGCPDAALFPLV